jgi:CPA1 family monovalent cation:H+ antiporter
LIIVTFVTLITWRLKFPSTIALILAGILASVSTRIIIPELSSEIFLSLLLPPILFQETLHMDIDGLIKESDSVFAYAIIGTLIMQFCVAGFTWLLLGFNVYEALLFGILIAPTDPVAVIRTFHSLGVDQKFQIIVSGESLFNDGIAIVIYSILVSIISRGSITIGDVGGFVFITIFGGIIIGILSGYLVHSIFCWTDDRYAEVLVSFITAFGVFRVAEEIGASGVLAIVVSGLLINYRSRKYGGLGGESYDMLEILWEFIGFLASSIAFIFIGMNLEQEVFIANLPLSFALLFIILSFRFIMVEILSFVLKRVREKEFTRDWKDGLLWSGLRGAVSIVLVLGISGLVPKSGLMSVVTFGIVILSNVFQGMSMDSLIKNKGLAVEEKDVPHETFSYTDNYSAEGYDPTKGFIEKLVFSAPEFFVHDTRFGSWLARELVSLLSILNRYSVDRIPKSPIGFMNRLVVSIGEIISSFLTWINQYLIRREFEKEENA